MPYPATIQALVAPIGEAMANAPIQNNAPWPSLEIATSVSDKFNFALICSLALGAIASFTIVWMGIVKEKHWELLRRASDEKIAALNRDAAHLSADLQKSKALIAQADARAAEANAAALKAQLELERLKAPPRIDDAQKELMMMELKAFRGQKFSGMVAAGVEDAQPLWARLAAVLEQTGWVRVPPYGLAVGAPPAGIPVSPGTGVTIFVPSYQRELLGPAGVALLNVLKKIGVVALAVEDAGPQVQANTIAIEIGIKPP